MGTLQHAADVLLTVHSRASCRLLCMQHNPSPDCPPLPWVSFDALGPAELCRERPCRCGRSALPLWSWLPLRRSCSRIASRVSVAICRGTERASCTALTGSRGGGPRCR